MLGGTAGAAAAGTAWSFIARSPEAAPGFFVGAGVVVPLEDESEEDDEDELEDDDESEDELDDESEEALEDEDVDELEDSVAGLFHGRNGFGGGPSALASTTRLSPDG